MADRAPPGLVLRADELRRNWNILAMVACVLLTGLLSALWFSPFAWLLIIWGGLFLPIAVVKNAFPRQIPRDLSVTADGIVVDAARAIPRADIEEAYVERGAGFTLVKLRARRAGVWRFAFRSPEEAHALLDALALGPDQRRASFRARSPLGVRFRAMWIILGVLALIAAYVLGLDGAGLAASFLLAVGTTTLALVAIPARAVVGADGVHWRWLFTRRFLPFRDVRAIERLGGRPLYLRFVMRTGRAYHVGAAPAEDPEALRGRRDEALADRVCLAFDAFRAADHADPAPLLARGERSVTEWARAVAALLARPSSGYRDMGLTREHAWRMVRDPAASDALRAGAGAALAACGPDERASLREAASACANPRVRVALEALAASDREEDWARALGEIAPEEAPDPRKIR